MIFPLLSAAVRDGDVNWTKAREITRVVTAESETSWVKFARTHTTREVERRVVKSPRQWKKEQHSPRDRGEGSPAGPRNEGSGESRHEDNLHQQESAATGEPDEPRRAGSPQTQEGSAGTKAPRSEGSGDAATGGTESRRPVPGGGATGDQTPSNGASETRRANGSWVEEQDLFEDWAPGASHGPADPGHSTPPIGNEGAGGGWTPTGHPAPTPSDVDPARRGGQSTSASASPAGHDENGAASGACERQPEPGREHAPGDDAEDSGPEVPPDLQRVGLRFLLTGVQQRMFEMAASVLKTRNRSLRRREDVLEEMCRQVLAGVASSASSRVRSTLVVYRDPATGANWVETDRGPLRVARGDVEKIAAEGEVVQVARPASEATLADEILDRSLAPRAPRRDVREILESTPLTSTGFREAPEGREQPSAPGCEPPGISPLRREVSSVCEQPPAPGCEPPGTSPLRREVSSACEQPPVPGSEPPGTIPLHLKVPSTCEQTPEAQDRGGSLDEVPQPAGVVFEPPSEGQGSTQSPSPGCTSSIHSPGGCPRRAGAGGRRAPVPAAVLRKLWLRSGGRCENPGCGRGGPLHVHHDDAYSDHPHHDPDRMRLLCERCHGHFHDDDFATRLDWAMARAWSMSRTRANNTSARDAERLGIRLAQTGDISEQGDEREG